MKTTFALFALTVVVTLMAVSVEVLPREYYRMPGSSCKRILRGFAHPPGQGPKSFFVLPAFYVFRSTSLAEIVKMLPSHPVPFRRLLIA